MDMLDLFEPLARAAGRKIMDVRARGFDVEAKGDASPVTVADRAGEAIILDGLRTQLPDAVIVAEEEVAEKGAPELKAGAPFLLVDALDGTREFISGNEDFTVNIALIENGMPVAGIIHVPATDTTYGGGRNGAWKRVGDGPRAVIGTARCADPLRVVASRSHRCERTEAWIAQQGDVETVSVGSSLKFCQLAEGLADIYPRFSRTMEWDIAAGDAILRAAGGATLTPDGKAFRYGKPAGEDAAFANGAFIAYGRAP